MDFDVFLGGFDVFFWVVLVIFWGGFEWFWCVLMSSNVLWDLQAHANANRLDV